MPGHPLYCDVSLPVPLDQSFTYRMPETLRHRVQPGCRVLAPFGTRTLTGLVLKTHTDPPQGPAPRNPAPARRRTRPRRRTTPTRKMDRRLLLRPAGRNPARHDAPSRRDPPRQSLLADEIRPRRRPPIAPRLRRSRRRCHHTPHAGRAPALGVLSEAKSSKRRSSIEVSRKKRLHRGRRRSRGTRPPARLRRTPAHRIRRRAPRNSPKPSANCFRIWNSIPARTTWRSSKPSSPKPAPPPAR